MVYKYDPKKVMYTETVGQYIGDSPFNLTWDAKTGRMLFVNPILPIYRLTESQFARTATVLIIFVN